MTEQPLPPRARVVIVGAGPTGLTLAAALARAGVDHVLLDRQAEGANTSRAAVVHARTLEALEEVGVTDELLRRGLRVPRFTVRSGSRRLLTVSFAGLATAYPFTLMLPQCDTEQVLLARLHELGGRVLRPYEVAAVTQDAQGACVLTTSGQQVRADLVVGADGLHSTVRAAAGIPLPVSAYAESFVLADVAMQWQPGRKEVSLTFGRAGLTVVAPLPGDRYRVVATLDQAPPEPGRGLVQRLLDECAPGQARVSEVA